MPRLKVFNGKVTGSSFLAFLFVMGMTFPLLVRAQLQLGPKDKIESQMADIIQSKGIPGMSLAITRGDQTYQYVAGFADLEEELPMQTDHRLLLGSVGKTFVAAQALLLVQQGQLKLEDKVDQYLGAEDWYQKLPNASDMTVHQIMNHTSGAPEYVYAQEMWRTISEDENKQWTVAERMGFIADAEPHFEAGASWSYADANYIILGAVIEKITGEKLYDLVRKNMLEPLQLNHTEPSVTQKMPGLTAAYSGALFGQLFGEKIAEIGEYKLNPQFEWAGGGFVTNPADLSRKVLTPTASKPN